MSGPRYRGSYNPRAERRRYRQALRLVKRVEATVPEFNMDDWQRHLMATYFAASLPNLKPAPRRHLWVGPVSTALAMVVLFSAFLLGRTNGWW